MHTAYTYPMHRIPEHVVRSHSNFVVGHGKPYTKTFTTLACPTGHQHRQTSRCLLESITAHDYITLPSHSHSTTPHTRSKTDGCANRMSRLPATKFDKHDEFAADLRSDRDCIITHVKIMFKLSRFKLRLHHHQFSH